MPPRTASVRQVVAVIDRREALESVVGLLQSNGFDRSQISLLGTRDSVGRLAKTANPESLPIPSADSGGAPAILSGDILIRATRTGAPAAVAAMAGASTTAIPHGPLAGIGVTALPTTGMHALGALLAKLFPTEVADHYQEQIESGGVLVWVSLPHPEREATAREILGRHAGQVRASRIAV